MALHRTPVAAILLAAAAACGSSTTPGPDENAAAAQEQRLPQVDDVLRENPVCQGEVRHLRYPII